MSILSNHFPEVLDELNGRDEAAALAGAPASWSQPPTDEEINAIGDAAGQLLTAGGDTILGIIPESAPVACRQVAAPTNARQARTPRQKPARSVRLLSRTHGMYELPDMATVEITMTTSGPRIGNRVDTFRYTIEPLASDFGRAFQVTREDTGETYAVNLNGRQSSCECAGHLRHGGNGPGGFCKHISGLQALVNLGKL